MSHAGDEVDCLIIGGGPAGLTAAIYAARFCLRTVVIDGGASRAALIPCTRNHAGFPEGISGAELLSRMRTQAIRFGVELQHGRAVGLLRQGLGFTAQLEDGALIQARAIILATGVTNHAPPGLAGDLHTFAIEQGLLRYCPVCDGFEVIGRKVGVIGAGLRAVREASFLRAYTRWVSVIAPRGRDDFDSAQRADLASMGVEILQGPARDFHVEADALSFLTEAGRVRFQTVYPALGSTVHSDLAIGLGADCTPEGCIEVDAHQRTSVAGLYAAGDVVIGLDQISHAMGEAGVAATTLRNDLALSRPQRA